MDRPGVLPTKTMKSEIEGLEVLKGLDPLAS